MRVGIPHAGNIYIPFRTLFRELGTELVVPPPNNQRALDLGVKYAPEGVCIPFKLTLGNLIEACELGADTVLQAGGFGICRLSYYAKTQKEILHDLGYDAEMLTFDVSQNKLRGILQLIKHVSDNAPWSKVIPAFRFGLAKVAAVDDIEKIVHKMRAVELEKGTANRIYREAITAIDEVADHGTLKRVVKDYSEKLYQISRNPDADSLKVGIVGEIFVVLDPFSNLDLEVELGKLGVEVKRAIFFSRWTKFSLFLNPLGVDEWKKVHEAAMPYLKRDVGGDGWESVGEKVFHAHQYDGIVHVAPFTCMPEVVAQNIMPSTKEDIPVLTLLCDEQTAKPGMLTRLEAFVDMLNFRRKRIGNLKPGVIK
ncbi:MAG TPA: CoA protein activase [Dehalococcoidia bacterium]|nr:CoA protein activase [Dehalococcoidia bacterium]